MSSAYHTLKFSLTWRPPGNFNFSNWGLTQALSIRNPNPTTAAPSSSLQVEPSAAPSTATLYALIMATPNGGRWYNSGPGPSYSGSNNSNGYGSNPYPPPSPIAPGRPQQSASTPTRPQLPPPSTNRYSNFEITIPVNRWSASHSNSNTPNTPSTPSNSMDPHLTLISMAEGYFEAAHASGYKAALAKGGGDAKAYYKLIATGLRALEAALQVGVCGERSGVEGPFS